MSTRLVCESAKTHVIFNFTIVPRLYRSNGSSFHHAPRCYRSPQLLVRSVATVAIVAYLQFVIEERGDRVVGEVQGLDGVGNTSLYAEQMSRSTGGPPQSVPHIADAKTAAKHVPLDSRRRGAAEPRGYNNVNGKKV